MLKQRGMSTKGIADILCVSETFIRKVIGLYENTAKARMITGKQNAIF